MEATQKQEKAICATSLICVPMLSLTAPQNRLKLVFFRVSNLSGGSPMENRGQDNARKTYTKPEAAKVQLVPEDTILGSGISGGGFAECDLSGGCE